MKKSRYINFAIGLVLGAVMLGSVPTFAASETQPEPTAYVIARTKAWDGIDFTLGGVPESVRKIEYSGSTFYLAPSVSDTDFLAVLAAGPEAVNMKTPVDAGRLYNHPAYILWNADKTILLVHPIVFDYDDILEAVAIPADPPAGLTGTQTITKSPQDALAEAQKYMLSAEYIDAVRNEFYKLLNEHRAANGLRKLDINLELQDYADVRADELRTRSGHTRPDGTSAGSGWHDMVNVMNSRYAENSLSTGVISADPKAEALKIFTAWKESKGHNKHFLYDFSPKIEMAFGIAPKLDDNGRVTSGAIFASGY